jgi:pimeloyl-ACP methyl ester carboxylesterase
MLLQAEYRISNSEQQCACMLLSQMYTNYCSAAIAQELVKANSSNNNKRTVYIGHSMGAVAAAVAAVNSDVDPRCVTLVLVAPALSGATSSSAVRRTLSTKFVQLMQTLKLSSAAAFVFNWAVVPVMLPVTALLLHPLVYNGKFWKVRATTLYMKSHA